jgi:hypothetical protein
MDDNFDENDMETEVVDDYEEDEDIEDESEYVDDYEVEAEIGEEFSTEYIIRLNELDDNHRIIRVIPSHKRITSNIIQESEIVEAIGIRASQIENGSQIFTDCSGYTDPIEMAKKEFYDRKSPLILERALKKTDKEIDVEHWKVRKMKFPYNKRENPQLTDNQLLKFQQNQHVKK